jgi:PLP dependent protein
MIASNIDLVRGRIEKAAKRSGRDSKDITFVCVTKTATFAQLKEAIEAGITDIGENRVNDALLKHDYLKDLNTGRRWHMIGHLQTNKVKKCLRIFDIIHSLDSIKLADEINIQARSMGKVVDCFIEVNISEGASKYGIDKKDVSSFLEKASTLDNVRIIGLMAMAPIVKSPEDTRVYFRKMRILRDDLEKRNTKNAQIRELSIGMTQDFEVAIEEGATFVRIGSAIFNR